jgi:hypothetical protein
MENAPDQNRAIINAQIKLQINIKSFRRFNFRGIKFISIPLQKPVIMLGIEKAIIAKAIGEAIKRPLSPGLLDIINTAKTNRI